MGDEDLGLDHQECQDERAAWRGQSGDREPG